MTKSSSLKLLGFAVSSFWCKKVFGGVHFHVLQIVTYSCFENALLSSYSSVALSNRSNWAKIHLSTVWKCAKTTILQKCIFEVNLTLDTELLQTLFCTKYRISRRLRGRGELKDVGDSWIWKSRIWKVTSLWIKMIILHRINPNCTWLMNVSFIPISQNLTIFKFSKIFQEYQALG